MVNRVQPNRFRRGRPCCMNRSGICSSTVYDHSNELWELMTPDAKERQVKGRLVEDLVQKLHQSTDLMVQSRVSLPTQSNPKLYREVDVLATGTMLGRAMHIAFECKNYGKRISVSKVDEFRGKLEAVGIPVQHGVMIASANGYTADSQARANDLGIKLLILDGITNDRLATEVYEAFQSIVYLLPTVRNITITNNVPSVDGIDLLFFRDQQGRFRGSILDLIWAEWRDGSIPLEVGDHKLTLRIPTDWHWLINGHHVPSVATARVQVSAYVITFVGQASHITLRDAVTGQVERTEISAAFPDPDGMSLEMKIAASEADLKELISSRGKLHIAHHRVPLPRIRHNLYWPPSERAILMLDTHIKGLVQQGIYDFENHQLGFEEIEGSDLSRIWEPIWPAHPASRDQAWPWTRRRRIRRSGVKAVPTSRPRRRSRRRKRSSN